MKQAILTIILASYLTPAALFGQQSLPAKIVTVLQSAENFVAPNEKLLGRYELADSVFSTPTRIAILDSVKSDSRDLMIVYKINPTTWVRAKVIDFTVSIDEEFSIRISYPRLVSEVVNGAAIDNGETTQTMLRTIVEESVVSDLSLLRLLRFKT